jgi:hypothetical protein
MIAAEDLDHDDDPRPFKRQKTLCKKTLCTDQELLEIFNATTGLGRTLLQPMVWENDLPKLPQLSCMKDHCEDISMSSSAATLAAY